jgi:7-cyano-7-deazaguanosine (preQ0) biosynthesis protein QueE
MSLKVCEIFYSIQGEGPNIGKPAVFLRLGGCNQKCKWCDTKYALNSANFKSISNKKIIQKIKKYPCKNIVITGGEPLLQQDSLKVLLDELPKYTFELETNGSLPLKINNKFEQINCSPKLTSSGTIAYSLKLFPNNKKVAYKFVICNKSDVEEVKVFCRKYKIPKEKVWLMPEGSKREIAIKRSIWLIELCKKEGYNFSPRLHIMLWGNKRGV